MKRRKNLVTIAKNLTATDANIQRGKKNDGRSD